VAETTTVKDLTRQYEQLDGSVDALCEQLRPYASFQRTAGWSLYNKSTELSGEVGLELGYLRDEDPSREPLQGELDLRDRLMQDMKDLCEGIRAARLPIQVPAVG
jgi:hypothetical protein